MQAYHSFIHSFVRPSFPRRVIQWRGRIINKNKFDKSIPWVGNPGDLFWSELSVFCEARRPWRVKYWFAIHTKHSIKEWDWQYGRWKLALCAPKFVIQKLTFIRAIFVGVIRLINGFMMGRKNFFPTIKTWHVVINAILYSSAFALNCVHKPTPSVGIFSRHFHCEDKHEERKKTFEKNAKAILFRSEKKIMCKHNINHFTLIREWKMCVPFYFWLGARLGAQGESFRRVFGESHLN